MDVDLDELERMARKATPGPWTTTPDDEPNKHLVCTETGAWFGAIEASPRNAEDAAYIAAANPAVVLELIAEVRRLYLQALSDSGQCIEEHIWPGHPKYEELLSRLRAADAEITKLREYTAKCDAAISEATHKEIYYMQELSAMRGLYQRADDRARAAEGIVRDLAVINPATDADGPVCTLCNGYNTYEPSNPVSLLHNHAESCPYRRAKEFVDAK